MRGPSIFHGYLKHPEKTESVLSKTGWFSTGELGKLNADGSVEILECLKTNFINLSGQFICPEKIKIIVKC